LLVLAALGISFVGVSSRGFLDSLLDRLLVPVYVTQLSKEISFLVSQRKLTKRLNKH